MIVVWDESGAGGVEGREEMGEGLLKVFEGILAVTSGEWLLLGGSSYSVGS